VLPQGGEHPPIQARPQQEIQQTTGEAERLVYFVLPPGYGGAMLRNLPGFESYDERYECLRCLKPGTGTKDAPRAFSLKCAKITRSEEGGFRPTTIDQELELKHSNGEFVAVLAKHVDDVKIAGTPDVVKAILKPLERAFGKLTYHERDFTNVCLHHQMKPDGSIVLDKDQYLQALKPIVHPDLVGL
jgi:hypothetical protein